MAKSKSIKFTDYVNVVKPQYVYLKLTPNNSIRNKNTDKIAKAIANLYQTVYERIEIEEQKLIEFFGKEWLVGTKYLYKKNAKVVYYVYIEKNKVEFYFILPKQHVTVLTERIKDSWNNLTVKEVNELPILINSTCYQMLYQYEDGVSIAVDKRDNALLKSNLNIINTLEDGDKVAIIYNFIPTTQYGWQSSYKETLTKIKKKQSISKNKLTLMSGLRVFVDMVNSVFESVSLNFMDSKNKDRLETQSLLEQTLLRIEDKNNISQATANKRTSPILKTQIYIQSQSSDKLRQFSHAKSLSNSFDTITEDNKLVPKRVRNELKINEYNMTEDYNLMSADECSNFIALPGRDLLDQYNIIEKIDTNTIDIPEEVSQGTMCIGEVTHQGKTKRAYMSTDKEYRYLSYVVIGPTRAGKSYFISNIMADAINNGECAIIFDFCGNCELSDDVTAKVGNKLVLNIDCSDLENIQAFDYNEVPYSEIPDIQYDNAKKKAIQLITLINACNNESKELQPRMERYLLAASLVAFINNGSVKDVFDILQNHHFRMKMLEIIPDCQADNMEEYYLTMKELDEIKVTKKDGIESVSVVGTKATNISGIMDRLNKLKLNTYIELMLKKDNSNNINLVEEIQKNQLICIRMPDRMFATDQERDIYCLYWLSKIWLALQIRKATIPRNHHVKVNVVIDELYQVNNTEAFLTDILSRLAKYSAKPIISCHYINQMKTIRSELRSANCSYMLVSGCDKDNYKELKSELEPFTEDDLLRLPKFHSLNYIKTSKGYARFISKLPS